jgi:uncharacterized membrane protein
MKKNKSTKIILTGFLVIMLSMIGFAIFYQEIFIDLLSITIFQSHARFIHIVASALFFSNAIVGMLWEWRSHVSGNKVIILHTYKTVAFLDSLFSSPLIILLLLGGLSLSFRIGDLWQIGWLSLSFVLFLFSGALWVLSDIPTQYRVKKLIDNLNPEDELLPDALLRLLKLRWLISLSGLLPLLVVFILMIYKPDITPVAYWFK